MGLHLTLERRLTTAPFRTYYLVNNFQPRWYTRICWNCGHKHNPTTAESCVYCQTPLRARRFLMSARWGSDVRPFHAFASLRLRHPALATPIVLYELGAQILAVYELGDEAMLADEPLPLHPRTLLAAAWSLASGLHHLHRHGVALRGLGLEHIWIHKDHARLFDFDVAEVRPRPIPAGDPLARRDVCALGSVLRRLVPLDQPEIMAFFADVEEDVFPGALAFQRELQSFARGRILRSPSVGHAALSTVGQVRADNEDNWGWKRTPHADIYAVADGMGGYHLGKRASATAVETALRELALAIRAGKPSNPDVLYETIFGAANTAVLALTGESRGPVGTTLLVAVVWRDGEVHVAHVGDSRAYQILDGALTPLTEDHSMVAAMVAAGKIDRETARTHPKGNILLQYLGERSSPEPDVHRFQARPGLQILLCTDGLWGEIPENVLLERLIAADRVRHQVRAVVHEAYEAGGKDNITAMLITV